MPDKKEKETKPEENKLKPCCACPETRKPRDAWYVLIDIAAT